MNQNLLPPDGRDDDMWTSGQGTNHDDSRHHYARIIAFAFFRSWERLPPSVANMLAQVIPVLINRASHEPLVIGIELPGNVAPETDTDRRKDFEALVRTVRKLHRAKVRCLWWAPNEDYSPEQVYLRHTVDLAWTTELRANPRACQIVLVFGENLRPVLSLLARMAGLGDKIITSDFAGTVVEIAEHDGIEAYLRKNRR
ncbi:MAG: hypothetical protein OXF88_22005 [Rhodobacteraceae bacterium]|nr:hypothetical protein [Paracoccaceae bacterium]MCY4138357.1 hypothetical protein [Paracoccaceae bacterium]